VQLDAAGIKVLVF